MLFNAKGTGVGSAKDYRDIYLEPGVININAASEMAKAMVAYAFEHNAAAEVVAVTVPANISSQRVLEKAGLIRVENIVRDGEDLAFFKKIG